MKSKSPWTPNVALKMFVIFSMLWLCISDINFFYNLQMNLLKICWLTFSSLLCNFCILLFTHPALPYPHFLPLSHYMLPSSPTLASTVFPLPLPHLLRLYNLCITAAWANVSTHLLSPSLPSIMKFNHVYKLALLCYIQIRMVKATGIWPCTQTTYQCEIQLQWKAY